MDAATVVPAATTAPAAQTKQRKAPAHVLTIANPHADVPDLECKYGPASFLSIRADVPDVDDVFAGLRAKKEQWARCALGTLTRFQQQYYVWYPVKARTLLGPDELSAVTWLPDVAQLRDVTQAHLCRSKLTEVPPFVALLPNLQELWLEFNSITTIGKDVALQLGGLSLLSLVGNPLTPESVAVLKAMPALKKLYLQQSDWPKRL